MKCDWCDCEFEPDEEAMLVIEGQMTLSPKSERLVLGKEMTPKYFHKACLYEVAMHAMELDDEYLAQVGANVREMLEEELREKIYDELTA